MEVRKMNIGDTVYTVNGKTNGVDTWQYDGVLPTKDGLLLRLVNGKKICYLPKRCVFETELEAKFIAGSYN